MLHANDGDSRLTDPECHKEPFTGVHVTDTEQGESSLATCSSGIGSCYTDDDDDASSTDTEDDNDDDGFDSDDSLSFDSNGKWTSADSYNLTKFDQTECGTWAIDQPLPLPLWAATSKEALVIDTVRNLKSFNMNPSLIFIFLNIQLYAYEDLVALIETTLQHMIQETHYDTVNNFIDFYQSFKDSHCDNLREFFQNYSPPVNRRHHMCVSLGMEIVSRVALLRPDIAEHFYLVSCEEAVEDTISYIAHCEEKNIEAAAWSLEKEHALVAMKISVAGREGLMILDPGYHVARAVTVMKDQCYPHTGFFTQSNEPGCKREYCYTFSHKSDCYITWRERITRNGQQKYEISIIYVDRPYRTAIDVTVRRNLVYDFRSLLSRDAKGRVFAGIYFPVLANPADANITVFYNEGIDNKILKTKVKFGVFKDPSKVISLKCLTIFQINEKLSHFQIPDNIMNHLNNLVPQLRIELSALIDMLKTLAEIVNDTDFVKQTLTINDVITVLSADN